MEKKTVTREMIVDTAAFLLEENGGIKSVTLREIAKRLGCAHTNLYNYFGSLTEIYWEVAGWILSRMISELKVKEHRDGVPEGDVFRLLSHFADFSIDHPGWYQFLWLEALVGEPSQHVIEILKRPADYICDSVRTTAGVELPEEKVIQIGDIMFSYTYGEISTWIHHRTSNDSRDVFQTRINTNLHLIYSLMLQNIEQ